jgi:hypothetical protein
VSFFLRWGSTPWRVVKDVLECGELLVSDGTAAELQEVLRRSRFDRYVSRTLREEFLPATGVRDSSGHRRADPGMSGS